MEERAPYEMPELIFETRNDDMSDDNTKKEKETMKRTPYKDELLEYYVAPDPIFNTRRDAENVLADMRRVLNAYGCVSVADMLNIANRPSTYADSRHGWTSLYYARVIMAQRYGTYKLSLPKTCYIGSDYSDNKIYSKNPKISYRSYYSMSRNRTNKPEITRVIFNNPATIVFWSDGTKTVVKCDERDEFDHEKGLAMAIAKKSLGNNYEYYETIKKFLPSTYWEEEKTAGDLFSGLMNEALTVADKLKEEASKQRHDLVRKAYEILKASREFKESTDIDKLIDCLGEALGIRKDF